MRQIWHHNARPVLYEESLEVTNLYQSLAPAGPLFTFDKEAAAAPASTNMLMLTATWTAYLELLDRMPLDPAWHAARRLLARCAGAQAAFLYAQNYTNTAEFLFGVALRLSPGEPDPYLRWARILLQREKYGQAVKTLSLYLEHNPSNETVHACARECATNMQRHAQIAALEYERQRHPLGISNTMLLAQLYSDAGRISNALECAQWALDTAATNANELEWYAAFFARHGEFDRADSVYARLLECDPGNFNYWTSRAALAFDQDNGERAVAFLRHAADIDRQRLARLLSINKVVHAMHERGRTNLAAQLEQLLQPGGTVPSAETNPVNGNEP
jgi:tetratricopeptide (TPR) repeat protein